MQLTLTQARERYSKSTSNRPIVMPSIHSTQTKNSLCISPALSSLIKTRQRLADHTRHIVRRVIGLCFVLFTTTIHGTHVETTDGEKFTRGIGYVSGDKVHFFNGETMPLEKLRRVEIQTGKSAADEDRQRKIIAEIYKLHDFFDVERDEESANLIEDLLSKRYDVLEKKFADARSNHPQYGDGYWRLPMMYGAITNTSLHHTASEQFNRIDEWVQEYPKSVYARTAKIWGAIAQASLARGQGYSNTVTPRGRRTSAQFMASARRANIELNRIGHDNPAAFDSEISLALGKADSEGILEIVDRATDIEPLYWPIYSNAIRGMLPRWGAGPGAFNKLISLMDAKTPGSHRDEFYYRIAVNAFRIDVTEYARGDFDWQRIKQGFEDMNGRYRLTDGWLHRMATMAFVERDREALATYFSRTYKNGQDSAMATDVWKRPTNLHPVKLYLARKETVGFDPSYADALRTVVTGDMDKVKALYKRGYSHAARDHLGRTLLHNATLAEKNHMVELLLSLGADPDSLDGDGAAPIHLAAWNNSASIFRTLVSGGADVYRTRAGGFSALMLAARNRNPRFFNAILDSAPDSINLADRRGITTLMYAAKYNNERLAARLLTESNLNLDAIDSEGNTALHYSMAHGDAVIAAMLLDAGADHSIESRTGTSIADLASESNSGPIQGLMRRYGIASGQFKFPKR